MGPAGQLAEHKAGFGLIRRFAKKHTIQGDQGIGSQDQGLGEAVEDCPGLGGGKFLDQIILTKLGEVPTEPFLKPVFITVGRGGHKGNACHGQ